MSPFSKSRDIQDESNPSIGKGRALADRLSGLNSSLYTDEHKRFLVSRFIVRMGYLLPPALKRDWLMLPPSLGGLGLGFSPAVLNEHKGWYECGRKILTKAIFEGLTPKEYSTLQSLLAIRRSRGMEFKSLFRDSVEEYGLEMTCEFLCLPPISSNTIVGVLEDILGSEGSALLATYGGIAKAKSILKTTSFKEEDDFMKMVLRGVAFNETLSNQATPAKFKTLSWEKRFNKLQELEASTEEIIPDLAIETISDGIFEHFLFAKTKVYSMEGEPKQVEVLVDGRFCERLISFDEAITKGLPSLRLPAVMEPGEFISNVPDWAEVMPCIARRLSWIQIRD